MSVQHCLAILLLSSTLSACAGATPPPLFHYDSAAFKPAVAKKDPPPPAPPPPIAPGTVFGPVLPVDSKPLPTVAPAEGVDAANRRALREPSVSDYVNAAQIYPYSENALYRLYIASEEVSDIALQPGETLAAISAGDTVRWVVGNTASGSGTAKQVHVLVKPFAAGLSTDLVILTDRHTYHLKLQSTEHTSMAAVSWRYPADNLISGTTTSQQAPKSEIPIDTGIAIEDVKFRYTITGDSPPWRPVRAFDDTHKVYIEFPDRIDQGEAPPLFVVGPDGDDELVNYRMRGNYYVVDRLFGAAELRLGGDKQQVVRISRTDGQPAPKSGG
jgi:type IV secretion system protein VirB9